MAYFMPSEVARLIVGYLIERGLQRTLTTFFQECSDLTEFYQLMKTGRMPPITIMGQSLMDILNEFAELKLKAARSGTLTVQPTDTIQCNDARAARVITQSTGKMEAIIQHRRKGWKERTSRSRIKSRMARKDNAQTGVIGGNQDNATTSVSASTNVVHPESSFISTPSHITELGSTDIATTIAAPVDIVEKVSTVAVDEYHLLPQLADVAVDTEPREVTPADKSVPDPSATTRRNEDENTDFLDLLLEETHFHEKLAENINRALLECGTSSAVVGEVEASADKARPPCDKDRVGKCAEVHNKAQASMANKGFNIHQIIEMTESDPSFQNFLQLFQQGTSIPISHFDVPVVTLSSELPSQNSGALESTTLSKAAMSQCTTHEHLSAKSQDSTPIDLTLCTSSSPQTDTLPADIMYNPLPKLGMGGSDCAPVFSNCSAQVSTSDKDSMSTPGHHYHSIKDLPVGQENVSDVTDLSQTSSVYKDIKLREMTAVEVLTSLVSNQMVPLSGSDECSIASRLNCVQLSIEDQASMQGKQSTTSNSQHLQSQCSPTSTLNPVCRDKDVHNIASAIHDNNSLTAFSLIEKSVAEMTGEKFVHRSLRNFSQSLSADSSHFNHATDPHIRESVSVSSAKSLQDSRILSLPPQNNSFTGNKQKLFEISSPCRETNTETAPVASIAPASVPDNVTAPVASIAAASVPDNVTAPVASIAAASVPDNVSNCECTTGEETAGKDSRKKRKIIAPTKMSTISNESAKFISPEICVQSIRNEDCVVAQTECRKNIAASELVTQCDGCGEASNRVNPSFPSNTLHVEDLKTIDKNMQDLLPVLSSQGKPDECDPSANSRQFENMHDDKSCHDRVETHGHSLSSSETLFPRSAVVPTEKNNCVVESRDIKGEALHLRNRRPNSASDPSCSAVRDITIPPLMDELVAPCEVDKDTKHTLSETELKRCNQSALSDRIESLFASDSLICKHSGVKRSQSLSDFSFSKLSQENQKHTRRKETHFSDHCHVIGSPPYCSMTAANSNSPRRFSISTSSHNTCLSLPATFRSDATCNPPCSQSLKATHNSLLGQVQVKGHANKSPFYVNSSGESHLQNKTVQRKVITIHSDHAPFIPNHCKQNPSRRIVPTEVDYSTPSPLQDFPSSPMSYVVDVCQSHPSSPFREKETVARQLSAGKSMLSPSEHKRMSSERTSTSNNFSRAHSCEEKLEERVPKVATSQSGIKLPPSPSRRKPRRVRPIQLSTAVDKGWSSLIRSSPCASQGMSSPVLDDAKIVTSTSDVRTSTEVEAFRMLKSFLASSYSKPQPRQEITSTDQAGTTSTKLVLKSHRGRGRKNVFVRDNLCEDLGEVNSGVLQKNQDARLVCASNGQVTERGDCCGVEPSSPMGQFRSDESRSAGERPGDELCPVADLAVRNGHTKDVCTDTHPPLTFPNSDQTKDVCTDTQVHVTFPNSDQTKDVCTDTQVPVTFPNSDQTKDVCTDTQVPVTFPNSDQTKDVCTDTQIHLNSPNSEEGDKSFTAVGLMEYLPEKADKLEQIIGKCRSNSSLPQALDCNDTQSSSLINKSKSQTCDKMTDKSSKCGTNVYKSNNKPGLFDILTTMLEERANCRLQSGLGEASSSSQQRQGKYDDKIISANNNRDENIQREYNLSSADKPTRIVPEKAQIVESPTLAPLVTGVNMTSSVLNPSCQAAISSPSPSIPGAPCTRTDQSALECVTQKQPTSAVSKHDSCKHSSNEHQLNVSDNCENSTVTNAPNLLSQCSPAVAVNGSLQSLVLEEDGPAVFTELTTPGCVPLPREGYTFNTEANYLAPAFEDMSCLLPRPVGGPYATLLNTPVTSSDVNLTGFLSSSLRLAYDIEHTTDMTNSLSSPIKHYSSVCGRQNGKVLGQDLFEENTHVQLRPDSPSSRSLLSTAMANCGIPFEGSNHTIPQSFVEHNHGLWKEPHTSRFQTLECSPSANAHKKSSKSAPKNTATKIGRKPQSKAQKPSCENVSNILPRLGVQNWSTTEGAAKQPLEQSHNYSPILPKPVEMQNAVIRPPASDNSMLLCQIQVIPSANGPVILIPPGHEGALQKLLSDNIATGFQRNLLQSAGSTLPIGDQCAPNVNMKTTERPLSTSSLSVSCHPNLSCSGQKSRTVPQSDKSQAHMESIDSKAAKEPDKNSSSKNIPHLSASKSLADITAKSETHNSLPEQNKEQPARASKTTCPRKIAVKRRIEFTHVKTVKNRHTTKSNKKEAAELNVSEVVSSEKLDCHDTVTSSCPSPNHKKSCVSHRPQSTPEERFTNIEIKDLSQCSQHLATPLHEQNTVSEAKQIENSVVHSVETGLKGGKVSKHQTSSPNKKQTNDKVETALEKPAVKDKSSRSVSDKVINKSGSIKSKKAKSVGVSNLSELFKLKTSHKKVEKSKVKKGNDQQTKDGNSSSLDNQRTAKKPKKDLSRTVQGTPQRDISVLSPSPNHMKSHVSHRPQSIQEERFTPSNKKERKLKQIEQDTSHIDYNSPAKIRKFNELSEEENYVCSSKRSVRLVVDYSSGEVIKVGTVLGGDFEECLTSNNEQTIVEYAVLEPRRKKQQKPENKKHYLKNINIDKNILTSAKRCNGLGTEGEQKLSTTLKLAANVVGSQSLNNGCQYIGSIPMQSLQSLFDCASSQESKQAQQSLTTGSIHRTENPEHECKSIEDSQASKTSNSKTTKRRRHATLTLKKRHGKKRLDAQREPAVIKETDYPETISHTNRDSMFTKISDNETESAVASLELCMREENDVFHYRNSEFQHFRKESSVHHPPFNLLQENVVEALHRPVICSPIKQANSYSLCEVSPMKLHLPPKKRLSSDFISNGKADPQNQASNSPQLAPVDNAPEYMDQRPECFTRVSSVLHYQHTSTHVRCKDSQSVAVPLIPASVIQPGRCSPWSEQQSSNHTGQDLPLIKTQAPSVHSSNLSVLPKDSSGCDVSTNKLSVAKTTLETQVSHSGSSLSFKREQLSASPSPLTSISQTSETHGYKYEVSNKQTPGDNCGASNKQTPGDNCGASNKQTPGDNCGASDKQTLGDNSGASNKQTPGDNCGASDKQTPGDNCGASNKQTPGDNCGTSNKQTLGDNCGASNKQTPGDNCGASDKQTLGLPPVDEHCVPMQQVHLTSPFTESKVDKLLKRLHKKKNKQNTSISIEHKADV